MQAIRFGSNKQNIVQILFKFYLVNFLPRSCVLNAQSEAPLLAADVKYKKVVLPLD